MKHQLEQIITYSHIMIPCPCCVNNRRILQSFPVPFLYPRQSLSILSDMSTEGGGDRRGAKKALQQVHHSPMVAIWNFDNIKKDTRDWAKVWQCLWCHCGWFFTHNSTKASVHMTKKRGQSIRICHTTVEGSFLKHQCYIYNSKVSAQVEKRHRDHVILLIIDKAAESTSLSIMCMDRHNRIGSSPAIPSVGWVVQTHQLNTSSGEYVIVIMLFVHFGRSSF